jgi:hypothetical protein
MAKWKEIKEITTEDESKKTEKKTKKYTGQFAPLLKIHTDRLAQAKEMKDSAKILTAEYEIDRINELIDAKDKLMKKIRISNNAAEKEASLNEKN